MKDNLRTMLKLLADSDDNENSGNLKAVIDKLLQNDKLTPKKVANALEKYSYELVNSLLDEREQKENIVASVVQHPTLKEFLKRFASMERENRCSALARKIESISTEQETFKIADELHCAIYESYIDFGLTGKEPSN